MAAPTEAIISAGKLDVLLFNSTKQPNMFVQGVRLKVRGHDDGCQRTESRFNPSTRH